ncbi:hypothetical protein BH20CHL6_BH20CHL6_01870 [soil metagenome]
MRSDTSLGLPRLGDVLGTVGGHRTKGFVRFLGRALIPIAALGCTAVTGPTPRAPSPVLVQPEGLVQFTTYGEEDGYRVAAPVGARVERQGNRTAYVLQGGPLPVGSITVVVTRHAANGMSADDLLDGIDTEDASAPAETFELAETAATINTARAFPVGPGDICSERWIVEGATVQSNIGYRVQVSADAPERCDARTMADTQPILETFEVLAP